MSRVFERMREESVIRMIPPRAPSHEEVMRAVPTTLRASRAEREREEMTCKASGRGRAAIEMPHTSRQSHAAEQPPYAQTPSPHSSPLRPSDPPRAFTRDAHVMAIQSTLRPSKERVAQLVDTYARHRPLVQRTLTAAFAFYVVSSTYRSLSARPPSSSSSSSSRRKGKGKDGEGGSSKPRVAVRSKPSSCSNAGTESASRSPQGRCPLLSEAIAHIAHRHPEPALQRGPSSVHAL